jgi:hypothetical protein
MNIRKLLDWRKLLLYSHRWMGIAFGLLFVSWFISGIAFMYWGMPQLSAKERLDHMTAVDLSKATLTPAEAAKRNEVRAASLRIEMEGDRPVYNLGRDALIYADTGEFVPIPGADREQALEIIRKWVPEHAATVRYDAYLEDSDQWTLQSAQRNQLPGHRIALDDDAGTYYYVSEASGEIIMKTDRASRFKGFWSGVLHWVYFVPLRKNGYAWNQFIIWGSFAGAVMCLTGLVAGVWRLSVKARFRQKHQPSHSPYSGLMRWHHYSGLLFGLLSFTWIISGAFSVNPFGMFSSGRGGLSRAERDVLTGGSLKLESASLESLRKSLAEINTQFDPKQVDVQQFRGKLYMTATRPPSGDERRRSRGERGSAIEDYRMVWLANPEQGTFKKFDNSEMDEIADKVMAGVPVQDRVWLTDYDNYYRSRDNARPLPVLRVRYLDEQRTWLYFDPHRGSITQQSRSSRMNRWLYAALHEFDWPFLYERRPLWDITVIVLSIGGILLSGTTLWPMMKRLARHGRRFAGLFRPARAPRSVRRVEAD